jgi:hypothetical protein
VLAEPDAPQPSPSIAGKTEGVARESNLGHTLPGVDPDGQTRDSRGGQKISREAASVGVDKLTHVLPHVTEPTVAEVEADLREAAKLNHEQADQDDLPW